MISKWIYILIGDNNTGKTIFQKELLKILCDENRDSRLYSGKEYKINHPYALKNSIKLFLGNRSYQEKKNSDIATVEDYFEGIFIPSDICILSSHLNKNDIQDIIKLGKEQFYNIGGVFFTNSIKKQPDKNKEITRLDWDEKFIINNKLVNENINNQQFEIKVNNQIRILSREFSQMLINRMITQ